MPYTVFLHYYSDHGNGPTTARVVVEVDGAIITDQAVPLIDGQYVTIGTYTPVPQ
jgi:hypothetical protein